MKIRSLVALSFLLLAGCGKEPVSTQAQQPATDTNNAPATVVCPEVTASYDPMPPGLVVSIPYHLRGDRIVADKKGNYRRHVTFEYLSGDATSVFDSIVGAMTGAGYAAKEKREKDGRLSIGFIKKGVGAVLLSVNPKTAPTQAHPDAQGMFVLNMPYKGKIENAGVAQEAATP